MHLSTNGVSVALCTSMVCLGVAFAINKYSRNKKRIQGKHTSYITEVQDSEVRGLKERFLNFASLHWIAKLKTSHKKQNTEDNTCGQSNNAKMEVLEPSRLTIENPDHNRKTKSKHNFSDADEDAQDEVLSFGAVDNQEFDHTQSVFEKDSMFYGNVTPSSSSSSWETVSDSNDSNTTCVTSLSTEDSFTFELVSPLEDDAEDVNRFVNLETNSLSSSTSDMTKKFSPSDVKEDSGPHDLPATCVSCMTESAKLECKVTNSKEDLCIDSNNDNEQVVIASSVKKPGHFEADVPTSMEATKLLSLNIVSDGDYKNIIFDDKASNTFPNLSNQNNFSKHIDDGNKQSPLITLTHVKPSTNNNISQEIESDSPKNQSESHFKSQQVESNISEKNALSEVDVSLFTTVESSAENANKETLEVLTEENVTNQIKDVTSNFEDDERKQTLSLSENIETNDTTTSWKHTSPQEHLPTDGLTPDNKDYTNLPNQSSAIINESRSSKDDSETESNLQSRKLKCDAFPTNTEFSIDDEKSLPLRGKANPQTSDKCKNFVTTQTTIVDVHASDTSCCDEKSLDSTDIDGCTCNFTSNFLGSAPDITIATSPDSIPAGNTNSINHTTGNEKTDILKSYESANLSVENSNRNFVRAVVTEKLYLKLSKEGYTESDSTQEANMGKAWYPQKSPNVQNNSFSQDEVLKEVQNNILQTMRNICTAVTQTSLISELSSISDLDYSADLVKISIPSPTKTEYLDISSQPISTNEFSLNKTLKTLSVPQDDISTPPSNEKDHCEAPCNRHRESIVSKAMTKVDEKHKATDTAKVQNNSVIFFGTRPGPGTPTVCCLDVQVKVLHTDSRTNENTVIENYDACDFIINLKKLDGLTKEKKAKVYIKIILENCEAGFKRKKIKTKPVKISSSILLNKEIVLKNIPRRMLARGKLLVAVWSCRALSSNEKLCSVDILMGKQMRFGESRSDILTLFEKLLKTKNDWLNSSFYLS